MSDESTTEPMNEPTMDKPSSAFVASKGIAILAIGWFGYMAYLPWSWYAQKWINALLPVWNTMFGLGVVLIVVQLYRNREWARRWLQSAALATAIMNGINAMKPGLEMYWIGVVVLGFLGWSLHAAREDYVSRDSGTPPGMIARTFGMAILVGTIIILVLPSSTYLR